jgi:hydrogenase-4 transcriptional activator
MSKRGSHYGIVSEKNLVEAAGNEASGEKILLMSLWREACRHIEIQAFTETLAGLLQGRFPFQQIWVLRLDQTRPGVETLAVGVTGGGCILPSAQTPCPPGPWQALLAWCRRGVLARGTRRTLADEHWPVLVPAELEEEILAGVLGTPEQPQGILIAAAPPGASFRQEQESLFEKLLEPFSIVLENDHRLRELAALREAAEADKRSLLTRLGRKALVDTIVGVESGLQAVMERVELVAPSDAPVLIFGETGTGKELVARAIHTRSRRSAGPFHRVNCGAIPSELIDSQLFGHERGAFTGAVESRRGWFERADGGTLFLDEIGELPAAAQVRLLRILQDGWLERVGGEQPIHVNVRMIAATNRDLAAMVADGRFREDLWYRIAVFPIVLPTLRERREDIPSLVEHFAERAATRFGLAPVKPSRGDVELLKNYAWPGNIRELAAVIDRAAILGDGKTLEVAKALGLPTRHGAAPGESAPSRIAEAATPPARGETLDSLNAVLRRHIEAALASTKGRVEGPFGAARILQINPHTLRAKMRKLGINWRRFREPSEKDSGR